ncbi:hypothetical protein BD626DRAFT_446667 [Schizophyllum amplum]|uniref:Uncharacterized protein n=1 Tax=Schizophyllum amplum TaxID=97359 RepID=A0A550CW57_9AGAR|nr:hypothetical protein BD626DRAFT_446667 [Auriculariopsis ampla]
MLLTFDPCSTPTMSTTKMPITVSNSDDLVSQNLETPATHKSNALPSPSPRDWQTCPLSGHQVLGYVVTKAIAHRACQQFCPLPDNPSAAEVKGHFFSMVNAIPLILAEKIPAVPHRCAALVYKDSARMDLDEVIILADNRGVDNVPRQPPEPAVVEMIADELQLEGAEREPRWYSCVD